MKTCKNPNCATPVNEQQFTKKASSTDGLATVCKVCKAEKDRLYREQNKEKIQAVKKEYRVKNLEKVKKANQEYYNSNKEVISKKTREYREQNKEVLKRNKAEYYKTAAGKMVAKNAKNTRRAIKSSTSDGTVTKEYLEILLTTQQNRCFYCDAELDLLPKGLVHLDHYIPLSKGGAHSCGNVVWSCSACNLAKHDEVPTEPLVFKVNISQLQ